jgi:hypothetical protein
MFAIPIALSHNLYLSANYKQFLTEFAGSDILFHFVYMWERTKFLRAIIQPIRSHVRPSHVNKMEEDIVTGKFC